MNRTKRANLPLGGEQTIGSSQRAADCFFRGASQQPVVAAKAFQWSLRKIFMSWLELVGTTVGFSRSRG